MAGNAYPHIVFAKTADVLPQQALADLLVGLFPDAQVEQGEIKATLTLADDYTATFWYDDDADGLGERYADYANPLRRKRVSRCTTMIDASGDADPTGVHARDLARVMAALADREGVYVFSEETKRFVGMDYDDALGTAPVTQPETDLRSDVSAPAHVEPTLDTAVPEVVLDSDAAAARIEHTEDIPVDSAQHVEHVDYVEPTPVLAQHVEPVPVPVERVEATPVEQVEQVERVDTAPVVEHVQPADHLAQPEHVAPAEAVTPVAAPVEEEPAVTAPDSPAAPAQPVEPARPADARPAEDAEPEKAGLFKRLFGRKR